MKEVIFEKAHLEISSELARDYFKKCGLEVKELSDIMYERLSEFITNEINILLQDKSYNMIPQLSMDKNIIFRKGGVFLYTKGLYFQKREAISFTDRITFCNWASGCNRIPYIKGFIKWCDYLVSIKRGDRNG